MSHHRFQFEAGANARLSPLCNVDVRVNVASSVIQENSFVDSCPSPYNKMVDDNYASVVMMP